MRYLLLLLVMLPAALAAEALVYDSLLRNGDAISIDGREYSVSIDTIKDELLLRSSDYVLVIDETECETLATLRFCFVGYDDESDGTTNAHLTIYRVDHNLAITRDFPAGSKILGEEYEVVLTIGNLGTTTAYDMRLYETLPSSLIISSVKDCTVAGQTITWTGTLRAGQDDECTYYFIPRESGDFKLISRMTYNDSVRTQEIFSDATSVTAIHPLAVRFENNDSTPIIGAVMRYRINISNNGTRTIENINISIAVPGSYSVQGVSSKLSETTDLGSQIISWSEDLKRDESEAAYFDMVPVRSGRYDILLAGSYSYRDHVYNLPIKRQYLTTEAMKPIIETSLTNGQEIMPGEPVEMIVWVQNPYDYENLTDIVTQVKTDLVFISESILDELVSNGRRRAVDIDFFPPQINISKNYPIHINVTARTSHGDLVSETFDISVIVRPVRLLSLSSSLSASQVIEGSSVTVSASISNPNNRNYSDVTISDSSSSDLIKEGTSSKTIKDLGAYASVSAYQYKIVAPDVEKETAFIITTTANYIEDAIVRTLSRNLTLIVKPRAPELSASISTGYSNAYLGERIPLIIVINNNDEETINNIMVDMSGSTHFVLGGQTAIRVGELDPGETSSFQNVFLIPSRIGSTSFGPVNISYEDLNGNAFSMSSNSLSMSVRENRVNGPLLTINKTYEIDGVKLSIMSHLTNIGESEASGNFTDGTETVAFSLAAGKEKTFTKEYTYDRTKSYVVKSSAAHYRDILYTAHAYSQSLSIPAADAPANVIVETPKPIIKEEPIVEDETETEAPEIVFLEEITEKPRKSVFVSIYEFIKKVLFWQRTSESGDTT